MILSTQLIHTAIPVQTACNVPRNCHSSEKVLGLQDLTVRYDLVCTRRQGHSESHVRISMGEARSESLALCSLTEASHNALTRG